MFPLFIKGEIRVSLPTEADVETIKLEICDDLKSQGIHAEIEGNKITFVNYAFFQWSSKRYIGVGRGVFTIEQTRIIYWLSTLKLIVLASAIVIFLAMIFLVVRNLSVLEKIVILSALWLYIAGLNFALTWFRHRRFMQRIATHYGDADNLRK